MKEMNTFFFQCNYKIFHIQCKMKKVNELPIRSFDVALVNKMTTKINQNQKFDSIFTSKSNYSVLKGHPL